MSLLSEKLLVFPTVLVLGLLSAGVAYACWSQTLSVQGSVETGELDWEFTEVIFIDPPGIGNLDYHCRDNFAGPSPRYWRGDKDVGSTWAETTDDNHVVALTLHNVYPCYFTMVSVYAHNCGTVPLIIDRVILNGEVTQRESPTHPVQLDLDGDGNYDVEVWWKDGFGTQLDPCEDSPEMSFWVHVLQDAPQGTTLRLTIEIVAVQWNEYVPP